VFALVVLAVALGLTGVAGRGNGGAADRPDRADRAGPDAATPGAGAATAGTVPSDRAATESQLGRWHLVDHQSEFGFAADQGVATSETPTGSVVSYRGGASITVQQRAEGWIHIGDHDIFGGTAFDAYQGAAGAASKMFLATTPGGASYEYIHPLDQGELFNNSFAAIAPGGQWLVAGEWETMTRLVVFPTPGVNRSTSPTGGSLSRAGDIRLDHPVRDIQGCDFVSATRLVCASNDAGADLFPTARQLLQVDLPAPLAGLATTGHVTDLGPLPQASNCQGTFEAQGIDFDPGSGILRIMVIPPPPCDAVTTVYLYRAT